VKPDEARAARNDTGEWVSTVTMRPDTNLTLARESSEHDSRMTRPRAAIRIAVLVAAVACLGLAMCARTRPVANAPANPPKTQVMPQPQVQPQTQQQAPQPPPPENPRTFPATKAPGRLY
jgi:hypothetical protein